MIDSFNNITTGLRNLTVAVEPLRTQLEYPNECEFVYDGLTPPQPTYNTGNAEDLLTAMVPYFYNLTRFALRTGHAFITEEQQALRLEENFYSEMKYIRQHQYQGALLMKRLINSQGACLLYTSPSPRDRQKSRMPSSA